MVKAKRKLTDLNNFYETNQDTSLNEIGDDSEYENEIKEQYFNDTVVLLRRRLIEYSEQGVWPLCELLDFANVENYVQWLLRYG